MDKAETITVGNVLLVSQRDYDFFLDAVSMYNNSNGSKIAVSLVKKNSETGDMYFKIVIPGGGVSMLNDFLEIGKRMMILKLNHIKRS